MIIRMQITAQLARALGGFFGVGGGGVPGLGFHSGGTGGGRSDIHPHGRPGCVSAPRFHTGDWRGRNAGELSAPTKACLTPGQMRQLAPVGCVGSGNVQVTVNNAPAGTDATATTSRDSQGNVRIDVWLQRHTDDTSAGLIATGQSAINMALERRYGLRPRL